MCFVQKPRDQRKGPALCLKKVRRSPAATRIVRVRNTTCIWANLRSRSRFLLSQTEKEIAKLEAKKVAAEAKAAEAAKKVEAEAVLKKLLASGMTADDILEKLK